jgi:hypothetical protein
MSSKSRIYLLLLHVDVILANVAREEAMALKAQLEKVFGTIQFEGGRLSYLGMQLELCDEGTIVDMLFYAKQLLEGNN